MPYRIIWELGGVVFRFSGVVTDEELITSNRDFHAGPLFPTTRYSIVDFSEIDQLAVSPAAVRAVAESDRKASETNPDIRIAIVTSDPFVRGMSNMYGLGHEAYGGSWITKIFESEEDARAWAVLSSA